MDHWRRKTAVNESRRLPKGWKRGLDTRVENRRCDKHRRGRTAQAWLSLRDFWQDCYVFACFYLLSVLRYSDVAVRQRGGGDVARALPAH